MAAVLGLLVLVSGCVVASPDADTFEDAAATTLAAAGSEVATVETMVSLLQDDKIPRPTVVAQLRYSEKSLAKTAEGFSDLNQPQSLDGLADDAGAVLDDAEAALSDARIAVHRNEKADYAGLAEQLKNVGQRLTALEESVS
ncbi:hypothetical protein ASD11_14265 [Aeromicrobium sp. Root495]|nr:hypothetical protein ASD11_14265 [Aeromicrobium sp. Root495]